MAFETIKVSIDGRVATVTLDRPSEGNAVDERLAFELADACDELDRDENVWVVVLTGAGEVFCNGSGPLVPRLTGDAKQDVKMPKVAGRVAAIDKPVIAALNGDALGQGLELALACDIRVASEGSSFGLTQVEEGTMPWDGGTQRLPRLIGRGSALEMILTSRVLTGNEALDMGLVNLIVGRDEVLMRAQQMAATIVCHGPIATRYLKEAVTKGMDMTLDQGLRLEADLNITLQTTTDRAEGIRSFLDRRSPEYTGE